MTPLDFNAAMNDAIRAAARRGTAPPTPAKAPGDEAAAVPGGADQGARSGPHPTAEDPLQQAVRAWRNREGAVTL